MGHVILFALVGLLLACNPASESVTPLPPTATKTLPSLTPAIQSSTTSTPTFILTVTPTPKPTPMPTATATAIITPSPTPEAVLSCGPQHQRDLATADGHDLDRVFVSTDDAGGVKIRSYPGHAAKAEGVWMENCELKIECGGYYPEERGWWFRVMDRLGRVGWIWERYVSLAPIARAPAVTSTATPPTQEQVSQPVRKLPDPLPSPQPLSDSVRERAWGATVDLVVEFDTGDWVTGTGSVVGADGLKLLTAFHVLGDPETGVLRAREILVGPYLDWTLRANILATDPAHDLAVVQVKSDRGLFASLELGDSGELSIGDTIYTLSYPANLQRNLEFHGGLVLGVVALEEDDFPSILTNAHAAPGSSGGVAIDTRGRLVGIIRAGIVGQERREQLGYPELSVIIVLTPVELAKPLLRE